MSAMDRSKFGRTPSMVRRAGRLAGRIAHGVGRLGVDAALSSARSIPRGPADLTPGVLSRLMGRRVETVALLDGESGTSSRARLALTGEDVPTSVFVKLAAASGGIRMLGELAGLGHTEVHFYTRLAPQLNTEIPRCHGAAFDPVTGRYTVVLEDMTLTPCQFADTLHPLSTDQMASLVETLAHLHGTFWGRLPVVPKSGEALGWLVAPSTEAANLLSPTLIKTSARKLTERTDIPVETGRFVWENYQPITELVDAGTHTVLHGDSHPGNTYFRDGRAGLLDWQVVRRGHPTRDLAYTLVLGMTIDDRRAWERELLDVYAKAVSASGGPQFERDELWMRYRQAVPYSYVSSVTTAGLGGMQNDEIALEGVRRAVTALQDLETVNALRPLL